MIRYHFLAALAAVVALSACEKVQVQDITGPVAESRVRFFNFGINAPSVNFFANDVKMTAVLSATGAESNNGVAYGSVGASGLYSAIAPGAYTFSGKITAVTDNGLGIASVPATLAAGKIYSLYLSGFYNTATKMVEGFVVEDDYASAIDYTQAYVRFVNASPNSQAMTLYGRNTTTAAEAAIGAAVAYKGAGAFTAVAPAVYDLGTRLSGVTTNAISRTAVSFVAGRVYTITARGDMTVTSTTATNRPFLDNTANR